MSRALARKVALALMVAVTAWSLWAMAEPGGKTPPRAAVEGTVATEGEGASGAGDGAHGEGPAPFNWGDFHSTTPPFIAVLVNFGLLAAGYYFLGRKPIAAALQSRRDTIAKEIEEAQRMRAEADARAKKYQAKLEKLEDEMRVARETLVNTGEAEGERLVLEAEAKAERMRKDSEFLIEQELKQVRADLLKETVEAAVAAAEELLKSRVTAADQERLADDYLADLGTKKLGTQGQAS